MLYIFKIFLSEVWYFVELIVWYEIIIKYKCGMYFVKYNFFDFDCICDIQNFEYESLLLKYVLL